MAQRNCSRRKRRSGIRRGGKAMVIRWWRGLILKQHLQGGGHRMVGRGERKMGIVAWA